MGQYFGLGQKESKYLLAEHDPRQPCSTVCDPSYQVCYSYYDTWPDLLSVNNREKKGMNWFAALILESWLYDFKVINAILSFFMSKPINNSISQFWGNRNKGKWTCVMVVQLFPKYLSNILEIVMPNSIQRCYPGIKLLMCLMLQ